MKKLNFLVIGAQKSGTTTLYKHLRAHPEIYLPKEKELAFFAIEDRYERGLDWLMDEYFSEANQAQLLGDVSPQYMSGLYVADRIAKHLPQVKLVAILRNPIDRAYSAYRMEVRRGEKTRSFSEVISDFEKNGSEIGANEFVENDYIKNGMYGHVLEHYLALFPKENIKVVFTEDLEASPSMIMRQLYKFLGVNESYVPEDIEKKFHQGGVVRWGWLPSTLGAARKLVTFLPTPIRKKLRGKAYWLEQWNIRPTKPNALDAKSRQRMVEILREDVRLLELILGCSVPWSDFN